jgi:hypothetical protein
VDVALKSVKVHHGNWKNLLWSGIGIPASIDEESLLRKFPGTPN